MSSASRPRAVILAGGLGVRVQHLLPNVPKPMAVAAGKPFLEWVVRFLAKQRFTDITISTGFLFEKIAAHFDPLRIPGIDIRCRPETEAMGTAGGFLNAIGPAVTEPGAWLVCNGDSLLLADLQPLLTLLDEGADAAILGLKTEDCSRYGTMEIDDRARLTRFTEKHPGRGLINAGVYLFKADVIRKFSAARPLSFETGVFPALIESGARIGVMAAVAPFLDIGTEGTLPMAGNFVTVNRRHFL